MCEIVAKSLLAAFLVLAKLDPMKRLLLIVAFLATLTVFTLGLTERATACPGCKEAMANQADEDEDTLATSSYNPAYAYSYSVLFMLGVPAAILLTFGTAFWRMTRKPRVVPEQLDWGIDERA